MQGHAIRRSLDSAIGQLGRTSLAAPQFPRLHEQTGGLGMCLIPPHWNGFYCDKAYFQFGKGDIISDRCRRRSGTSHAGRHLHNWQVSYEVDLVSDRGLCQQRLPLPQRVVQAYIYCLPRENGGLGKTNENWIDPKSKTPARPPVSSSIEVVHPVRFMIYRSDCTPALELGWATVVSVASSPKPPDN